MKATNCPLCQGSGLGIVYPERECCLCRGVGLLYPPEDRYALDAGPLPQPRPGDWRDAA